MTNLEALYAAVDQDPSDPVPKLMIADLLEEQGDPTAKGWRWLAENRKEPWKSLGGRWTFWKAPWLDVAELRFKSCIGIASFEVDFQRKASDACRLAAAFLPSSDSKDYETRWPEVDG